MEKVVVSFPVEKLGNMYNIEGKLKNKNENKFSFYGAAWPEAQEEGKCYRVEEFSEKKQASSVTPTPG